MAVKISYHDMEHRASAYTMHIGELMEHDTYLLTGIEVGREHRGKGVASRLLEQVLTDADEAGVQMALVVEPDGSIDSLDHDALEAFYRRHGFREYEYGRGLLRPPKADACLET